MATTDRTDVHGARATQVALTPDQAQHVAAQVLGDLESAVGEHGGSLRSPEELQALLAEVDGYRHTLDQLGWGKPPRDVTLTLPREELERLADELMQTGADTATFPSGYQGLERARKRRDALREAMIGVAILDQLEARR